MKTRKLLALLLGLSMILLPAGLVTARADEGYTVTYHSNYGDGSDETYTGQTNPNAQNYIRISDCTFRPPEGTCFSGKWNTRPDGSGNAFFAHTDYPLSEHTDLYAQWRNSAHTITVVWDSMITEDCDYIVNDLIIPETAEVGKLVSFRFQLWSDGSERLDKFLVRYFEDGEEKALEITKDMSGRNFSDFVIRSIVQSSFTMPDADVTLIAVGTPNSPPPADSPPQPVALAAAGVTLSPTKYTYNGKVRKPAVTVKMKGKKLKAGTDYKVSYAAGRKNAGTYKVTVMGTGDFTGKVTKTFTVNKAANPMKIKGKTATVKYCKVKKKKQTLKVGTVLTVKKPQGTVTYAKVSGNKKITVAKKTGTVTVKKGLKKGKYKVKVKVKAAGNKNYKAATKMVTFTVRVK